MTMGGSGHVEEVLPAYVNGTLAPAEADGVRRHVGACASCAAALEGWRAVAVAARVLIAETPAPSAAVWAGAASRIAAEAALSGAVVAGGGSGDRLRLAWSLLVGQVPLIRRGLWAASALTMLLGSVVAIGLVGGTGSGMLLALVAPVVAAVGVAFVYGAENDPSLELALATPTLPSLVLVARLTLVFGWNLGLALAATVALAAVEGGVGLWPLVALWLGPMLFLSALTLVLSLVVGGGVARLAAMGLWAVRLVALSDPGRGLAPRVDAELVGGFWQATPLLVALAGVLLAVALVWVPRQERFVAR